MRKVIQIGCFIAMFMFVSFSMQAQKVGYIDSDAILAEMPQVKQAQANLEVLRKQLTTKGQQMITDFQTKYQELQTCLLYTSPSPRDATLSRMPSSA